MKTIYYLSDYNWQRGEIVGGGKKNHKIRDGYGNEFYISKEKCAFEGESVCVVWEMWRGVNGRGGYRVERVLYPEHRVPAEKVYRQSSGDGRVNENANPFNENGTPK